MSSTFAQAEASRWWANELGVKNAYVKVAPRFMASHIYSVERLYFFVVGQ